jgi:RNA polymerase sigma factor (sigma-70 family)
MNDRRRRFEAQVMPHLDATYRFARWLARSPDDADAVVQEAMLRTYRGFDGLRCADAKAWLLTIVSNCHSTSLRQQQRRALVPLPDENDEWNGYSLIDTGPDPESASMIRDQRCTLEKLLAGLRENYREALILREIEDLGYQEIAAVINVPIGTVMSRLESARRVLRKHCLRRTEGESRVVP